MNALVENGNVHVSARFQDSDLTWHPPRAPRPTGFLGWLRWKFGASMPATVADLRSDAILATEHDIYAARLQLETAEYDVVVLRAQIKALNSRLVRLKGEQDES